jgi:hypothetical protein
LFAVVLFPGVAFYGWSVIVNLFGVISWFISNISLWLVPPPSCNGDEPSCLADVARSVAMALGNASTKIYAALNLSNFPVPVFLWFLLTAVLGTQALSFARKQITTGSIQAWYSTVPTQVWQRIAFAMLVLGSFYLGLSGTTCYPFASGEDWIRPAYC